MKKAHRTTIALAIALGLSAVTAYAGKPDNPPRNSGRDVIGDAQGADYCNFADPNYFAETLPDPVTEATDKEIFDFACLLLWNTDGQLIEDVDTNCPGSDPGNSSVTYTGRNCAKNEAALERLAASVVLSQADVLKGKTQQVLTAAEYACTYAGKAYDLVGVGKLDQGTEDLIADAEDIAGALGYPCDPDP